MYITIYLLRTSQMSNPSEFESCLKKKAPLVCSQQQLSPGYAFVCCTPVVDKEKRATAAGGLRNASGEIKLGASGPSVAPVSRVAHHHPRAPGWFYKQPQTRGGANQVESRGLQPGSHFRAFFFFVGPFTVLRLGSCCL